MDGWRRDMKGKELFVIREDAAVGVKEPPTAMLTPQQFFIILREIEIRTGNTVTRIHTYTCHCDGKVVPIRYSVV
jgi:hypothetical protein